MFGLDLSGDSQSEGLLSKIRAILTLVVRMVQNRLALAALGLQEEYDRLWPLLVRTLICFVLLSFGTFFLCLGLVVIFWDTYRLQAIFGIAFLFLVSGALVGWHVSSLWSKRHKLFSTTLDELEKDIQSLQE